MNESSGAVSEAFKLLSFIPEGLESQILLTLFRFKREEAGSPVSMTPAATVVTFTCQSEHLCHRRKEKTTSNVESKDFLPLWLLHCCYYL